MFTTHFTSIIIINYLLNVVELNKESKIIVKDCKVFNLKGDSCSI